MIKMFKTKTFVSYISFIIVAFTLLISCNQRSTFSTSNLEGVSNKIDSIITFYNSEKQFSGSVLVAEKGKVLFNKEYGYTDLDSLNRITKNSIFEIASITKQFTAMLIMKLKENNKLNYEDKIVKYFPNLPYNNITIRHLLTHTSGFSERNFFKWAGKNMNRSKTYTNQIVLEYLEKEKPELDFIPGEDWKYSNVGYFLLKIIIEKASNKHYIEYLNQTILEPLNMKNTGIYSQDIKGTKMPNYTFGKIFNRKKKVFASSFGMAWSDSLYGGVGILSNTHDLYKWDRALYGNELLKQKTLDEAFKSYTFSNDSLAGYGFGWYVRDNYMLNNINCGLRVDHNGLWPGYDSLIIKYLDEDRTIIILANQQPSANDKIEEEISKFLYLIN